MPYVVNGVGTWYYGKRHLHSIVDFCEFCNNSCNLESFDTTLYFVVVFIPLIPLGRKRILRQCTYCQKHRVLSLAKWEEAKNEARNTALDELEEGPINRDILLGIIGKVYAFQDEALLAPLVEKLPSKYERDPKIQTALGDVFAFFSNWSLAEDAYRLSLDVEDDEAVREQLGLMLIKQDLPDEAKPLLQHIIQKKKNASAGYIYQLIEGFQAQGNHQEALEIIDERDLAFPQWSKEKLYRKQRKISTRYRNSNTKTRSASYVGFWSNPLTYVIGAIFLALVLYFGTAVWLGMSRKVFIVNGTAQPYSVLIENTKYLVPASGCTSIQLAEGEHVVSFSVNNVESFSCQFETPFWSRPFASHTFIINPDQTALLMEEETIYKKVNPPMGPPPKLMFGKSFYHLQHLDYEFVNFPATITVSEHSQVHKKRVALAPLVVPEERLQNCQGLDFGEQIKICKKVVTLDPKETLFLFWLTAIMPQEEALRFLETRLDDKPILVEWHRWYQQQMELAHPETDLRPRYQKLLADSQGNGDALYLLGRLEVSPEESDKRFRQAIAANPPSGYAYYALGYRAFSEARYADARAHFKSAAPLMMDTSVSRQVQHDVMLASEDYDALTEELRNDSAIPARKLSALTQLMTMYAIRGDKENARSSFENAVRSVPPGGNPAEDRKLLEAILCSNENDIEGYLKGFDDTKIFQVAFLKGEFAKASQLINFNDTHASSFHGLLYIEASRANDKKVADEQLEFMLNILQKGRREEKQLADILSGKKPYDKDFPMKLLIEPSRKRVLLAVIAQRFPELATGSLALAKRLDYQHDSISLCLRKYLP